MTIDYIPPIQRSDLADAGNSHTSIAAHRVHRDDVPVAPFDAPSWPLAALAPVHRKSPTIHFKDWPHGFQKFARHVAYTLINHGNPESLIEQHWSNAGQWPSAATIANTLHRLRAQTIWLTTEWSDAHPDTPVRCPEDMDSQHLDDVKSWIEGRYVNAGVRAANLSETLRIWHLNPWLPDDCQWPDAIWRHSNWRPNRRNEENKTMPIEETTFSPMLEWAIAFVTSFAPDVLSAHSHYVGLEGRRNGESFRHAGDCLDHYVMNGLPLPPRPAHAEGPDGLRIGWSVMEYRHGFSGMKFASAQRRKQRMSLPVSEDFAQTALDVPVTGLFQGRPWVPFIGVYDVTGTGRNVHDDGGPLIAHLRTACLIVVAALTGMRPEELLNLRDGSALAPVTRPGGSRVQLIQGHVFKGVGRLEDGSPGKPRPAVWATIPVAAAAIRVVQQVNKALGRSAGRLFPGAGSHSVSTGTVTVWIESFIEFVNTRLAPHTAAPAAFTIPSDREGAICLRRFRRTLAWFLRHRPNGDVTLAIQYQHVGVVMGEGYAGTKASGMPDLLLEEDWNHRLSTIRHLGEQLSDGQGVGGPAANRALSIVARVPRQLLPADERRLRKEAWLTVYDNPAAIALCVYNEATALCTKRRLAGKDTNPDLLGCVDGCPNCARTDGHVVRLTLQARSLRDQAAMAPLPMAQSMLERAERNDRIVADFDATRMTVGDGQAKMMPEPEGAPEEMGQGL
jgi:hypothetical protein